MLGIIISAVLLLCNLLLAIYMILIYTTAKYCIFRIYKYTAKWLSIFTTVCFLSLVSIFIDKKSTPITLGLTIATTVISFILFRIYFLLAKKLNKVSKSPYDFEKTDFTDMITKYHIETKKGEMEKIISQVRKNKKNNIYEDYAIACNQLTSFNQKNFVIILQNIINFNNNVSILHKKRNQIIYKLTLYLCMDLQNAIKKGKEIKAKAS